MASQCLKFRKVQPRRIIIETNRQNLKPENLGISISQLCTNIIKFGNFGPLPRLTRAKSPKSQH